ncbi:alpha/beta fold hydrolase, partial [Streptomyces sp. t39]|uniref:alpha/beta fold hydrolase n=1 Tax=Streptomyces sp. t39 TaxID=1828156 RepID=UPI0011CE0EB6
ADGLAPPSALSLAGARMRPFTSGIARATAGHGIVVGRVRYIHRGWNGERADAARDAARALDELAAACGSVPVVLVGHSMGGRAALSAAAHPQVRGVVALGTPRGEPVAHLAGTDVVLVHGDRDRVTDPRGSWSVARRARAIPDVKGRIRAPARLRAEGGASPSARPPWSTRTAAAGRSCARSSTRAGGVPGGCGRTAMTVTSLGAGA